MIIIIIFLLLAKLAFPKMSYVFKPQWTNEGVGAKVIRIIGNKYLNTLDPFLMLDHFKVKLPAGFPDHPHRGFQTITYMKQGIFYHQDFKGHKGTIGPGDLQWMTAGKGIVHAEMPGSTQEDSVGFQLWLNLKSKDKMIQAKYQQYSANQIPIFQKNGAKVKIICGDWDGHKGPIKYTTPSYYMDVTLPKNGLFEIPIKKSWNSIIYPYQGSVQYAAQNAKHEVMKNNCCVLEKSENKDITHRITSKEGSQFILISGQPINQHVQHYGPFVMNTEQQIQQTFRDYQEAQNGFQARKTWSSKIRHMSKGKKYQEL